MSVPSNLEENPLAERNPQAKKRNNYFNKNFQYKFTVTQIALRDAKFVYFFDDEIVYFHF